MGGLPVRRSALYRAVAAALAAVAAVAERAAVPAAALERRIIAPRASADVLSDVSVVSVCAKQTFHHTTFSSCHWFRLNVKYYHYEGCDFIISLLIKKKETFEIKEFIYLFFF